MSEEPRVRVMQRAPAGTPLELASFEELCMEIQLRKPTAAVLAVAYPTGVPGLEHSGKVDLVLLAGGDPLTIDQCCYILAQKVEQRLNAGGGWTDG